MAESTDIKGGLLPNNFDLFRLVAASQVMVYHLMGFGIHDRANVLGFALSLIPGVPIFFFCSGFLISGAWERHPHPAEYALNRFLRIYPGYVVALLVSALGVLLFHPAWMQHVGLFCAWFAAQIVVIPFTPGFMRDYGLGHANGALWTIPVEIFFYVMVPCFAWLAARLRRGELVLAVVIIASAIAASWLRDHDGPWWVVRLQLSPLANADTFGMGMLAWRYRARLIPLARRWAWAWAAAYLGAEALGHYLRLPVLFDYTAHSMGLVNVALLAMALLGLGFTGRGLAERLLRRQDFSYGIYLFHWPIANMVFTAMAGVPALLLTVAITLVVAGLSWLGVEKPMLRHKREWVYAHG